MPRRAAYRPRDDRSRTGGWSSKAAYRRAHRAEGGYISVDPAPKCKPN